MVEGVARYLDSSIPRVWAIYLVRKKIQKMSQIEFLEMKREALVSPYLPLPPSGGADRFLWRTRLAYGKKLGDTNIWKLPSE